MTMTKYVLRWTRATFLLVVASLMASTAMAQEFPQASSASSLRFATGTVHDITELDADPHWVINGDWLLSCGRTACLDSNVDDIVFDLAVIMVRPDGAGSHSHTFTDFAASSVTVSGDDLIIDGAITGTGAVGATDIIITLVDVSTTATFLVEMPSNGHIIGPMGGVIVRSR